MRTLTTLFAGALLNASVCAQGVFTRIGSDGTTFYYDGVADLQTAFDQAATLSPNFVDTIIFTGGTFILTADLFITSPVVMIGSGIRSDSSTVYGGRTEFVSAGSNRSVILMADADGTEMHGLTFGMNPGSVKFGTNQAESDVDNVKFFRCSFKQLALGHGGGGNSLANNTLIEQCALSDQFDVNGSNGVLVRNSFVDFIYRATPGTNTTVQNCILTDWTAGSSNGGVLYDSNIFLKNTTSPLNVTEPGVYTHNLFVGNGPLFNVTFNTGIVNDNTYTIRSLAAAFPNTPVPVDFNTYEFDRNYAHTQFAGASGPVGIYGGGAPWKNGSLPFNPHWSLLTTPNNTAPNGVLQGVRIKASAQAN